MQEERMCYEMGNLVFNGLATSARYFSICDRVLYRAYVVHTADVTAQFL